MSTVYTGIRAEQLIKGVTKIVRSRSFQFDMVRVLMMAGIAQAPPEMSATTLRPFSPKACMMRSNIKAARAI